MDSIAPHPQQSLIRELRLFLLAVITGSLAGVATTMLLGRWVAPGIAANAALAVGTTCTGAAHSHFVHKQSWASLLPKIGVGAPLAYVVMQAVHFVLRS